MICKVCTDWTGMYDITGLKIHEGDLVELVSAKPMPGLPEGSAHITGTVEWEYGNWVVVVNPGCPVRIIYKLFHESHTWKRIR